MFDEKGHEIDLDLVDAISQLPDGRFDVWFDDERRAITVHPEAIEVWLRHVRSKTRSGSYANDLRMNPPTEA